MPIIATEAATTAALLLLLPKVLNPKDLCGWLVDWDLGLDSKDWFW